MTWFVFCNEIKYAKLVVDVSLKRYSNFFFVDCHLLI